MPGLCSSWRLKKKNLILIKITFNICISNRISRYSGFFSVKLFKILPTFLNYPLPKPHPQEYLFYCITQIWVLKTCQGSQRKQPAGSVYFKELAYLAVGAGLQCRTAGSGRHSFCSIEAELFSAEKLQLLPIKAFQLNRWGLPTLSRINSFSENQLIIDTNHNNKIPSQQHPN